MKLRCGALGYSVALLALLAMNLPGGTAQPAERLAADSVDASANGAAAYHIEVNMLASCLHYGCEHPLTEKNAILSEDGKTLPARVARLGDGKAGNAAPIPMHLLIAFAQGAPRPTNAELEKSLRRVSSAGWLVSVKRADGTFTPYCDGPRLGRELGSPSNGAAGDGGELSEIQKAIDDLSSRAGWRALLVDTAGSKPGAELAWVSQATSRLDVVYAVDGGRIFTFPDCDKAGGFDELGMLSSGTTSTMARTYHDGVIHEITWSKAIKHLVADREYVYDLEFKLPESAEQVEQPLALTLRDPFTYGPDPVKVELYTVASGSEGGAANGVRKSPGLKLTVFEPVKMPSPWDRPPRN